MFDIATRPNPVASNAALALPFDWQMVPPTASVPHPWTDFATGTGAPQINVELLQVWAICTEDTLHTAVTISLFTDRRARADEALPYGVTDRRGWVGEEFVSDDAGDFWGSAFWLLFVTKATTDILERARFAAKEALAWMVQTEVASKVEVEALWLADNRLAIRPRIFQGKQASPVYDVLWGTTIKRGALA